MSKSKFIIAMKENWPFIMVYPCAQHHIPLACSHKLPRFFLLLLPSAPKPLFCVSPTLSSYSYAASKTDPSFIHLSLLQSVCKQRWEFQFGLCVMGVIALVPRYVLYCLKHAPPSCGENISWPQLPGVHELSSDALQWGSNHWYLLLNFKLK